MKLGKLAVLGAVGAAVVIPATGAIAAKVVVVRSVGPSAKAYPPGKALPDSTSIKLNSGDMVMLLGPNAAKTLRGPGTFLATTAGTPAAAGRRGRFGALRTGEVAKNPGLWDLDISQSGKMCVAQPGQLKLWRSSGTASAKLNISGGGKRKALDLKPGQTSIAWPSDLPVTNGSEYQIAVAGGESSKMTFVTVKSPPSDLVGAAEMLIARGCQNQLDLLVASAAKTK